MRAPLLFGPAHSVKHAVLALLQVKRTRQVAANSYSHSLPSCFSCLVCTSGCQRAASLAQGNFQSNKDQIETLYIVDTGPGSNDVSSPDRLRPWHLNSISTVDSTSGQSRLGRKLQDPVETCLLWGTHTSIYIYIYNHIYICSVFGGSGGGPLSLAHQGCLCQCPCLIHNHPASANEDKGSSPSADLQ